MPPNTLVTILEIEVPAGNDVTEEASRVPIAAPLATNVPLVKNKKFDSYIKKDGGNLRKYVFDVVFNGHLDSFTNS